MSLSEFIITGENETTTVVSGLIKRSQWFEVTPLPHNQWLVAVKVENRDMLADLISGVK